MNMCELRHLQSRSGDPHPYDPERIVNAAMAGFGHVPGITEHEAVLRSKSNVERVKLFANIERIAEINTLRSEILAVWELGKVALRERNEARNEAAALRAENERLRNVLQKITWTIDEEGGEMQARAYRLAVAALHEKDRE